MNQNQKEELIRNQLAIAQTAIEAVFLLLQSEEDLKEIKCHHPEEQRKDFSTMSAKIWQCGICGYLYNSQEANEVADSS